MTELKWNDVLKLLAERYQDEPDDCPISMGHWEEEPCFTGAMLPAFKGYISVEVGDIKRMVKEIDDGHQQNTRTYPF